MTASIKGLVKTSIRALGYQILPVHPSASVRTQNPDITDQEWETILMAQPFTMTSLERILASIRSAAYVSLNRIPGDIVECGVWRGGSSMAIARTLVNLGDTSRRIYCYDTFEGMTEPTREDVDAWRRPADDLLRSAKLVEKKNDSLVWAFASLEDVCANLRTTAYPMENITFVKGAVEETIPDIISEQIALLRLDTDWYASTRHELIHLYPRLVVSGILIIDDYGHWEGSKRAVDEYFSHGHSIFFNRIDYTGRLAVKPASHPG